MHRFALRRLESESNVCCRSGCAKSWRTWPLPYRPMPTGNSCLASRFSSTMSQHDKAQQVQAVSIASNPSSTSAWLTRSSTLQPSMRVLACHIATGDWIERDLGDRSHLTQSGSFIDDYVISFRREILARWLAVISWHHWNLSSLERNFFTAA